MKPKEELLEDLKQTVINYDEEGCVKAAQEYAEAKYPALEGIMDGLAAGSTHVRRRAVCRVSHPAATGSQGGRGFQVPGSYRQHPGRRARHRQKPGKNDVRRGWLGCIRSWP